MHSVTAWIYFVSIAHMEANLNVLFCSTDKLMKIKSDMTLSGRKIDYVKEIAHYHTLAAVLGIVIPAIDSNCGQTRQMSTITTIKPHSPLCSLMANTM